MQADWLPKRLFQYFPVWTTWNPLDPVTKGRIQAAGHFSWPLAFDLLITGRIDRLESLVTYQRALQLVKHNEPNGVLTILQSTIIGQFRIKFDIKSKNHRR
jgi:hypothetical protein